MIPDPFEKTVCIPIKFHNGKIEFLYGGPIPELDEGTIGDLVVPEYCLSDKEKLKILSKENVIELLPEGSRLMVSINPKHSLNNNNSKLLYLNKHNTHPPHQGYLAEIILSQPLFLKLRGTKSAVLKECECTIPALPKENVKSVNHAYSLLSSKFETTRLSHTGNVFDKVYFCSKKANIWLRLRDLRDMKTEEFLKQLLSKKSKKNIG